MRVNKDLEQFGLECNPQDVIDDFVDITSLVIEEGGEYSFIHKGVQEFHAAAFVASRNDSFVSKFYSQVTDLWYEWHAELSYLRILDDLRFTKYLELPVLKSRMAARPYLEGCKSRDSYLLSQVTDDMYLHDEERLSMSWKYEFMQLLKLFNIIRPDWMDRYETATARFILGIDTPAWIQTAKRASLGNSIKPEDRRAEWDHRSYGPIEYGFCFFIVNTILCKAEGDSQQLLDMVNELQEIIHSHIKYEQARVSRSEESEKFFSLSE